MASKNDDNKKDGLWSWRSEKIILFVYLLFTDRYPQKTN